jgi:hypothetical protein
LALRLLKDVADLRIARHIAGMDLHGAGDAGRQPISPTNAENVDVNRDHAV